MFWKVAIALLSITYLQASCHKHSADPYSYQYNPYSFGYDVEDNYGNKQWRQEKSHNPMEVHGSYGYYDVNGLYREVVYVADKHGFRANVKSNEPGVAGTKDSASVKLEPYHSSHGSSYNKHSIPTSSFYKSPVHQ